MEHEDYEHILFSHEDDVLRVTLNRPECMNAVNERLHYELAHVWDTAERDPEVAVILVEGAGGNFCSGGDLEMVERMANDPNLTVALVDETADIAYGMINCSKPIVSAIQGMTIGAGMLVAMLADVSVVAETARLTDGHSRIGVVAGDHAVLIWPLLCGMAKAKRYLLTGEFLTGAEAEAIGLVSACVPHDQVPVEAMRFARKLAERDPLALNWTKRALNHWLRSAGSAFEHSLALEMLSFSQPGVKRELARLRTAKEAKQAQAASG